MREGDKYGLMQMLSCSLFPEGSTQFDHDGAMAIASAGLNGLHAVAHRGTLRAAIEGHPRWKDDTLDAIAARKGDAAALLEGFHRYGRGVLERLQGDFALAVGDKSRGSLLLAVDRLGIRPLAWTLAGETLVFGSQLSSLIAHPAVEAELDPQGIFNYLYFHMVPSPGTLFRDLYKLEPGQCLEFENGRVSTSFYWQLQFTEGAGNEKHLSQQLHQELEQVVKSCLAPPAETGTFLSGGLDSSTVTGVLQALREEPVDAFAIGFDAVGFDEMEYARATAEHFGARLHEYYVTPQDVLNAIPLASQAYDEPFGNASAIPAYFCARLARDHGKEMLLAGDGGDEIFAGNARYAKQKLFDYYRHVPVLLKTAFIEPLANHLSPLRKVKSYIEQAKVPMPERMETYNFLHRFALTEIFNPDFLAQVDSEEPIRLLRERWNQCGEAPLVKQMLFLDHKFTLADNDLRKVNRMCELAGIDVRYPLLQEEMVEFAAAVPADMLLQGQKLRSFYRHAMKGFLPQKTLEKHKHGFGLPFGLWMNEYAPLKEFAHDSLENIRKRGILNDAFISRIIEAQETGHATYYGVFIWVLIMVEQWLQAHEVSL
ncbi:MAG: asparagine synthase (glutamine-hydrolyzing) [Gammaproteobacteria bacterium]|nr:MAG: asparagine synthase (glutamine-hydrolyzing) [Gammaproteobacteria bacterium]